MLQTHHETRIHGERRKEGRRFYWTVQAMDSFEVMRPLLPLHTREELVLEIESRAKAGGRQAVGRLDVENYFEIGA